MSDDGFTLLEVLIGVVISGIILASVFMLFDLGLSSWDKIDTGNNLEQQWKVFSTLLKEDLHNIFVSPLLNKNHFTGNNQNISWLVLGEKGLNKVSYSYNPYQGSLMRQVTSTKKEKIISNNEFFVDSKIQNMNFYFYDKVNDYWKSNWSYQEISALPIAVKVEVENKMDKFSPLLINLFVEREY